MTVLEWAGVVCLVLLGVGALATISAPTAMGVRMAELTGLRFWGLCRPPQAVLYAPGAQSD